MIKDFILTLPGKKGVQDIKVDDTSLTEVATQGRAVTENKRQRYKQAVE